MWIGNKVIPIQKVPQRVTLHALSDWQLESGSCDKKLIRDQIAEIVNDPSGGMWAFLGDIEDDDRPSTRSKKAQAFADRPEVLDSESKKYLYYLDKEIIPLLLPLAKTRLGCIGVLAGHHWKALTRDLNSVQYICNRLTALSGKKVPYMGQMSAWVWLRFRGPNKQSLKKLLHIQHGEGGGQTLASALNKLELTSRGFEADALIRAHDCKLVSAKFDRLYPKDTECDPVILHKTVAMLNIGSATRGYVLGRGDPDYVESAMMRPTSMGNGKLHFDVRGSSLREDPSANWRADIKIEI